LTNPTAKKSKIDNNFVVEFESVEKKLRKAPDIFPGDLSAFLLK
jgi:hypothetical protein